MDQPSRGCSIGHEAIAHLAHLKIGLAREKAVTESHGAMGMPPLGTLAVTLRSASLVPCGHASRRLSSGFAHRRGRGADRPEAGEHKGRARLARLARQRDSEIGSHVGMLHAPAAASPSPLCSSAHTRATARALLTHQSRGRGAASVAFSPRRPRGVYIW